MPKQQIQPASGPSALGAYSPALRAGDFIFVSGQVGRDPATGTTPDNVEDQTRRALENVKALLAAGGASLDDVVQATVHLSDLALFARFNAVYAEQFNAPLPARTTVGCRLPGSIFVEIDVIAYVGR